MRYVRSMRPAIELSKNEMSVNHCMKDVNIKIKKKRLFFFITS